MGCLGRLQRELRKSVRADRAAYLHGLVHEVAAGSLQKPKQLLEPFRWSGHADAGVSVPYRLCYLRTDRWTRHFAQQEGGVLTSADGYGAAVAPQAPTPDVVPLLDITCVPTLCDVEQDLLRLSRGKAAGPDAVTADLLQLDVATASRRLLPIFAKAALGCREPVSYRGGCLIALAKKAFASLNCSDFRSILLSSVPGKLLHRALRRRLLPSLVEVAFPLQAGAVPGSSPDMLILYLTAFQRWAQATCGRWAVVFFDVKQAYYRALRQLVVDCDSDEGLLRVLHGLELPAAALVELRDMLAAAASVSPLARQQHLTALLRDLMTGTWFRFDSHQFLTVTHQGTRPCDPVADVLFAFTLTTFFRTVHKNYETAGLIDVVPAVREHPLVGCFPQKVELQFVSWADDFARPLVGRDAEDLFCKVRLAVQICSERATACGIELAYGADKTAAVFDKSTIHAFRALDIDLVHDGVSFCDGVSGKSLKVPVVAAYKHLGGIFSAASKPDLELFLRRAAAWGSIRPVRGKLFANGSIPLASRKTFLRSLGLSKFAHGSGALHLLQNGHRRQWHGTYVSLWSHLVSWQRGHKPHSYHVLDVTGAPPPHLFLALQRASLLSRLIRSGLWAIIHMLQLEWEAAPANSWLSQVLEDIRSAAVWVSVADTLKLCSSPLHELCEQLEDCPTWWTAVLQAACKSFADDIGRWKSGTRVISCPSEGGFSCAVCGDSFVLRSSLATHQARRHALWAPARHFAPHKQCVACLKVFGTVMLTQAHLRRNAACLRRAAELIPPLSRTEIVEAESADKNRLRAVKAGGWKCYQTVHRSLAGEGPHQAVWGEIEQDADEFAISVVAKCFRPDPLVLTWVDSFLNAASTSGSRQTTFKWWDVKPSEQHS